MQSVIQRKSSVSYMYLYVVVWAREEINFNLMLNIEQQQLKSQDVCDSKYY